MANSEGGVASKPGDRSKHGEHASAPQDRVIREPELTTIVPYSPMHIWRLEKTGRFPARIRLGANRVGWSLAEVNAWLNERKAQRERHR